MYGVQDVKAHEKNKKLLEDIQNPVCYKFILKGFQSRKPKVWAQVANIVTEIGVLPISQTHPLEFWSVPRPVLGHEGGPSNAEDDV